VGRGQESATFPFPQRLFPGVSTGLAGGTIWYSYSSGTTGEAGREVVTVGTVLLSSRGSVSGGDTRPALNPNQHPPSL
jgi:hypothetical protein